MSKKPLFTKIIITVVVALICLVTTLLIAFLFGSINSEIFDFTNLNFSNMLPVMIIGVFISCVIVGILVLILAKDMFIKVKDYFLDNKKENKK